MDLESTHNWHSLKSFQEGLRLQNEALETVKIKPQLQIIGLEHNNVVTLGIRGEASKDLIANPEGFEIVSTKRGGHATIHNPGQLVIYPIVPIQEWRISVKDYVCLLVKTSKNFFESFDLQTEEQSEPGLFTKSGKIALFGVQVRKGITQHGICINVYNDLSCFESIRVCGVESQPMDKLGNYIADISLEQLFIKWSFIFQEKLSQQRNS